MRLNPLSFRVVVLSWLVALAVWPLTWIGLAAAQGVGALLAGGGWIGIAVPLGAHPLGLVNEPTVAFAGSRAALWLYWLAPALAALAVSAAAPPLAPAPPGWLGELTVFHAAASAAVLGLGWAPPLGAADGPAAGLLRFWGWQPGVLEAVAAGAGAVTIQLAVARLAGHLWSEPGRLRAGRGLDGGGDRERLGGDAALAPHRRRGHARRPRRRLALDAALAAAPQRRAGLGRLCRDGGAGDLHRAVRALGGRPGARLGPGAAVGEGRPDEQRPRRHGDDSPHAAPRPENTAGTVSARILASSHSDQLSM